MRVPACLHLSRTNESSSFKYPPPSPWFLEIEGTQHAIRFSNFKGRLIYIDVLDVINEAQYDIMLEMAATRPPQDQAVVRGRAWTSDAVHLSINPNGNRMLHSICGLYLAAIIRLWGYKSEYDFYEADLAFYVSTRSRLEVIGHGQIRGLGSTAER